MRPGITGLSQVSGRNNLKWDERLEMDVKYVEEICFILDIRIAIDTIKKVFRQENIVVVMDPTVNVPLDEYRRSRN